MKDPASGGIFYRATKQGGTALSEVEGPLNPNLLGRKGFFYGKKYKISKLFLSQMANWVIDYLLSRGARSRFAGLVIIRRRII